MRRNPERLAWTVLLLSFAACVSLTILTPLAIRSFLTDSTVPLDLILSVQQGTALVQRLNSTDFGRITPDRPGKVLEGGTVLIDDSTLGVLSVRLPDSDSNLVDVQLYGNTDVTVTLASTPRFDNSSNPNLLQLFIGSGRIRVNVPNGLSRPTVVTVRSPQGEVTLSTGTYALEVSDQDLQVTVREGEAAVAAQGDVVHIASSQRAVVPLGRPPEGGLSGERNLIVDGSFSRADGSPWTIEHGPQDTTEAQGEVKFEPFAGRRAALFKRSGTSHAETRLVQNIDRDVTDAASLTLHFAVLIYDQDLLVCGQLGSECPLMVKINYRNTRDASAPEREWLQGFYSRPNSGDIGNPDYCQTCSVPNPHRLVPSNTWVAYDSGNLMDALTGGENKPIRITRITFYASGHRYEAAVTDIELLVLE